MPEEKPKQPLEELGLGEGLVCDPETGICDIPGVQPLPADKAKKKEENADGH